MDWNAEVEKWDKLLHSEGVPDAERTRKVEALFNAYAQAAKAIREAQAYQSQCRQAARLLPFGATEAARELDVHRVTVYRRAKVARRG